MIEEDVFVLVDEVVVVVDDVLEDDIDDDLFEELEEAEDVEDTEPPEELVLEELPELSDFEEPEELLAVPVERLPEEELPAGSLVDGFPESGFPKIELLEYEAVESLEYEVSEVLDDCRPSPDEIGSSVIPFHSEDEELPFPSLPCELCEPMSTIFTELLFSETSDFAQPLSRSTADKAAAKILFFILFSPFM